MTPATNRLLDLLPAKDRDRLMGRCETVRWRHAEDLGAPGRPTRHVYFPGEAFVSLMSSVDGHEGLDVGMVGREGMVGAELVVGPSRLPLRACVQGGGAVWRLGVAGFRAELLASAALRRVVGRYLCVRFEQLAVAATCLHVHVLSARLARWLLMSEDRSQAGSQHLTHEWLARMLGVRRVSVTLAAGALHRAGIIAYQRGELRVLDRDRLQASACSCYRVDLRIYQDLLHA